MDRFKVCAKCKERKPISEFRARSDREGPRARCKECEREDGRAYNASHKERVSEKNRRYHASNKDEINARHKKSRQANPERIKEYKREYYEANKDKVLASYRRYEKEHRAERIAKSTRWRINNPEKNRAIKARREAAKRGAPGSFSDADIVNMLARQGGTCVYHRLNPECRGDISRNYEIDHIMPLSRGGTNWPNNLQLICRHCNASKNSKTHEEFVAYLARKR